MLISVGGHFGDHVGTNLLDLSGDLVAHLIGPEITLLGLFHCDDGACGRRRLGWWRLLCPGGAGSKSEHAQDGIAKHWCPPVDRLSSLALRIDPLAAAILD